MLFSENPSELSEFYEKVFQKKPDMIDNGYYGFLVGQAFLTIGPHDKIKGNSKQPERLLLNFETDDVQGEFDRISSLSTTVIAKPYPMGEMDGLIATFADPDGNYFQLMPPWKENK